MWHGKIQVSWFTFDNIPANSMELSNKIFDKNTVSIQDSANDESADGDDGTQTDDDVGDTGDVNDHEFKEEEEVHSHRRSGLRHIKKRSSRETKYSEDYSVRGLNPAAKNKSGIRL